MGRRATPIIIGEDDRHTLERWVRSAKTEQRMALRARMILAAADGQGNLDIAAALRMRPATVSKWRVRYARAGPGGLADAPRPGVKRRYDAATERRILAQLDETPPAGHATWTGSLVAEALGDVSPSHVWRVLRRHGIHLQRRRS